VLGDFARDKLGCKVAGRDWEIERQRRRCGILPINMRDIPISRFYFAEMF